MKYISKKDLMEFLDKYWNEECDLPEYSFNYSDLEAFIKEKAVEFEGFKTLNKFKPIPLNDLYLKIGVKNENKQL